MALITNYATLQTAIGSWLNRTDLATTEIPQFIQFAENRMIRDKRIRDADGSPVSITALSTTNTTNWLVANYPDIYLYASLIEAAPFLKDDPRLEMWEREYNLRADLLSPQISQTRTVALTTYAQLQRAIVDVLDRQDLTPVTALMIQAAEDEFRMDERVRDLATTTFSITADNLSVPATFRRLESWYHDGTSFYGPIDIVSADELGLIKARSGATGPPEAAAIINGTFRFAPAPDATYSTKMVFWQTLTALSAGVNWLYTDHPSVYLYGALAHAGLYVDDPRVPIWRQTLNHLLEGLHKEKSQEQFSGHMERRFTPIGG